MFLFLYYDCDRGTSILFQALSRLDSLLSIKLLSTCLQNELQSRQRCVTNTIKMLRCQVALKIKIKSKCNLTPFSRIMKILMMHEREIFLDIFMWWPLRKKTGNMMWNLLSPENWFHYGTYNYKSKIQKKREKQGVEVWASYLAGTKDVSFQNHSLALERLMWMWHRGPEIKLTISTGIHWHIILCFDCRLFFSKIQARGCFLIILVLICLLYIPMSSMHIAKELIILSKPCQSYAKACKSDLSSVYLSTIGAGTISWNGFPRLRP